MKHTDRALRRVYAAFLALGMVSGWFIAMEAASNVQVQIGISSGFAATLILGMVLLDAGDRGGAST